MFDFEAETDKIRARLDDYRARGLRLFATSSFQTNSVVLLDLLDRFAPDVPVYFLNTGYHFAETLAFRRALSKRFKLKILDVRSPVSRDQQKDSHGRLLFTTDPDHCCHLNKVLPLEPVLLKHDVWVNGIRASQSAERRGRREEEPGRHGVLRYHPLLRWGGREIYQWLNRHDLPMHPLENEGYGSIGCQPCTRRILDQLDLDDRGGRWAGMKKTECGLHTGQEST